MFLLTKQYVIWLILLHLCCCDNVDYTDFHPESIPLQAENPSADYKEVMRNLCENWHSPISYLKKRGYMPSNIEYKTKVFPKKKIHHKNIEKGENYFFFPDNKEQRPRNSIILLENEESSPEKSKTTEVLKTEPKVTEPPPTELSKNDTTGIINKVKDKFLSIFTTHKNKSKGGELDGTFDLENPEFLENYINDNDEYEISERRIFARSVSEKSFLNQLNSSNENVLSNLTDTEIHFVKSFINWFKQNKDDLKFLSSLNSNITTTTAAEKNSGLKDGEKKSSTSKPDNTKQTEVGANIQSSTESGFEKKVSSGTKSGNVSSECNDVGRQSSTNVKTNQAHNNGSPSKNITSSLKTGGKDVNDFTVDLDINQKNGTGEEICQKSRCDCVKLVSTTPKFSLSSPLSSNRSKYITKSKFLAHLHHMVDEVGKPSHKPLDLAKVQDIIDNSKKLPTVTMGGDKTTQCAPLRLNDMSFDLEWNKINIVPQNNREKMNFLDIPYANQAQGQSLAAKFLQETNSYPAKNDEYLKTPYTDNFLDSQQSLPSDLELPLKSSTKREVGLPTFGKNADIYTFPEDGNANENSYEDSPKRRIKGRIRGQNKKKPKHKNDTPPETLDANVDFNDDLREGTDFDSFDELKDIQFRVNDDDEQAISTFISNLNSPPEVFSFDVDKYLRSAKQSMEPKAPEFQFQSPETRTYYEFMESPAIENERLPLIEAPSDGQSETSGVNKRSRTSPEKRDLLRQYIKGVSSALNHNFEDIYHENCNKGQQDDKIQRSPNFDSNEKDDSLNDNNYFILNDVSDQAVDVPKQDLEVIPNDYSPQSLEIDLDLDKKFRDLNIGRYNNDLSRVLASIESKNNAEVPNENIEVEPNDLESL